MRTQEKGTYRLSFAAIALGVALSGFGFPSRSAAVMSSVIETGELRASGGTATLGSTSQTVPIVSLANVNAMAFVEDGDPNILFFGPPGYYRASADLQTTLTSTRLDFAADVVAEAIWDGVGFDIGEGSSAGGHARVSIQFHLDADTPVQWVWSRTPGAFSGPRATLQSLDLGFVRSEDENGPAMDSCGTLSFFECDSMLFFGIPLPAGDYVLSIDASAHEPFFNSCASGCGSTGGTVSFLLIPEPSMALLLGTGFFALALIRRNRAKK